MAEPKPFVLDEKPKVEKKAKAAAPSFGNQLDRSAPTVHKGKSREDKTKKPTTLKKVSV